MSQSGDHLKSGQLGVADVTVSTVANIGPGIDFYFAFGVIAVTAGVAAPLMILTAGVAVVLLTFTVAEFTKAEPSARSGAPTGVTCGSSLSRLTSARGAAGAGGSGLEERLANLGGQRATNAHGVANGASSQNHPASVGCLLEEKGWVIGRRTFRIVEVLLGVAR